MNLSCDCLQFETDAESCYVNYSEIQHLHRGTDSESCYANFEEIQRTVFVQKAVVPEADVEDAVSI